MTAPDITWKKIYRALHAAYGDQLALSLEMFETDNQLVLDEYLQGRIDETDWEKMQDSGVIIRITGP